MAAIPLNQITQQGGGDDALFESICVDLHDKGYSIKPNALPEWLSQPLWKHVQGLPEEQFQHAGVGRQEDHTLNNFVRKDVIRWINGDTAACKAWLDWTSQLRLYLNRRLFLGLFEFESHFAHYRPGAFYKTHMDAFKGEANRVISTVAYFNPDWQLQDGGQLELHVGQNGAENIKVLPCFGTLVTFLSEDFPHQVLASNRDRYSIAGWFRVNSSTLDRVDPLS